MPLTSEIRRSRACRRVGGLGLLATTLTSTSPVPAEPEPPLYVTVRGGTGPANSSRDPTAASTVLRRPDLDQPGASSADALSRVPGVQVRRTGAKSDLATASIRGATSAQTPVYLGGVLLNDDVTGTADLSTIPLWMLDRVEVFRGNAPEQADRQGIGGAVFFEPRLPRRTELRAGQLMGSYASRSTWFSAAHGSERAGALLAVRRDRAANDYGYTDDAGTRFVSGDDATMTRSNADYTAYDAWTIGRYELGSQGHIVALMNTYDREQGVTGFSVIPAARSRARVRRELAGVTASVRCGSGPTDASEPCRLQLVTSAVSAVNALRDPARELSLGATRVDTTGQRVSELVRWRMGLSPTVSIAASGAQSFERLELERPLETGGRYRVTASRSVTRPAMTLQALPWARVETIALAALECHSTSGPEQSDGCGVLEPVGRAGIKLAATDWLEVLANVGRGVRVPTLGELFGSAPLVRGNPSLEPEVGTSVDTGVRLRGSHAPSGLSGYLDGFAFTRWVRDLVTYRRSYRQLVPFNVGRARVDGIELQSKLAWQDAVRTELAATLLDPRDVSPDHTLENDSLPFSSRLVLSGRLEGALRPSSGGVDELTLAVALMHRSSRAQDPAGLIVIPHQTTTDVEAAALLFGKSLALRAVAENVFEQPQWDLIGMALPGRSFYASAEVVLP
ncbi:MAG: TonB-dependent receptor [Polyangiaceae bacterium]|nr:TonB-dependent receptor [Polyangiaceae bacterium]